MTSTFFIGFFHILVAHITWTLSSMSSEHLIWEKSKCCTEAVKRRAAAASRPRPRPRTTSTCYCRLVSEWIHVVLHTQLKYSKYKMPHSNEMYRVELHGFKVHTRGEEGQNIWYREQTTLSFSASATLTSQSHTRPKENQFKLKTSQKFWSSLFTDFKDVTKKNKNAVWVRSTTQHATAHLCCTAGCVRLRLGPVSWDDQTLASQTLDFLLVLPLTFGSFSPTVSESSASNEALWEITSLFESCEGWREQSFPSGFN